MQRCRAPNQLPHCTTGKWGRGRVMVDLCLSLVKWYYSAQVNASGGAAQTHKHTHRHTHKSSTFTKRSFTNLQFTFLLKLTVCDGEMEKEEEDEGEVVKEKVVNTESRLWAVTQQHTESHNPDWFISNAVETLFLISNGRATCLTDTKMYFLNSGSIYLVIFVLHFAF